MTRTKKAQQRAEQALTQALAESQAERARLQAENERLREIVDRQAAWEPLGDDAVEATAVVHTDSPYSVRWVAIFADPWRAEQYAEWARTTQLPETADAVGNPDYCYPLDVDTLAVRISATIAVSISESKIAFWNSYDEAPTGHAPAVAEVLDNECPFCDGTGEADAELTDEECCGECGGTGRVGYDTGYYATGAEGAE